MKYDIRSAAEAIRKWARGREEYVYNLREMEKRRYSSDYQKP